MSFDIAILGLGGVGSACADVLSQHGLSVIGFDRHGCAHDRGSSHGQTRIFRTGYARTAYLPLLEHSAAEWRALQAETVSPLLHAVGHVSIVSRSSPLVASYEVSTALQRHLVPLEGTDLHERLPILAAEDVLGFWDPAGLVLRVEDIVRERCARAMRRGAQLHFDEPVASWSSSRTGVELRTWKGKYSCGQLVIAGGAWASQLTGHLDVLAVRPSPVGWFPFGVALATNIALPSFVYETPAGEFYGCARPGDSALKVGSPSLSRLLDDPSRLPRRPSAEDLAPIEAFISEHLLGVGGWPVATSMCMTTNTPTKDFVVSPHPDHANVTIVAGLSGHGFKLIPTIAETVASIVTGERSATSRLARELWTMPTLMPPAARMAQ